MYDTLYVSTFNGGKIYFRATYPQMDSFQWIIGSDLRIFKDSVFPLLFENIEGTIDVPLTAFHTPNPDCFPGDDGVDVVSK